MRITFVRSNTNAVGEYRSRYPARALEAMGHEVRLITLSDEPERVTAAEIAGDVLVLNRLTSDGILTLRDQIPPDLRPVTVYEVDDNPWEWHPWDAVHVKLGAGYARKVGALMARCDAIICSTVTLAERIRQAGMAAPLWVVPNAIDYGLRDWETREERPADLAGKTVLGWTGSIHHARDGGALLEALPALFEMYSEFVFLMQCDGSIYKAWRERLDARYHDQLRWSPPVPFDLHPRIYSLFDVNLAPLEQTPFNRCKSDLRLIEGGAHGVPYVAANIAPYAEFHRQSGGIGGFLASTPREWVEGIEEALCQRTARGPSLARYVKETRSLSVVAGQWETALHGALNASQGHAVAARPTPGRNDRCPCASGRKYKLCCIPAYG